MIPLPKGIALQAKLNQQTFGQRSFMIGLDLLDTNMKINTVRNADDTKTAEINGGSDSSKALLLSFHPQNDISPMGTAWWNKSRSVTKHLTAQLRLNPPIHLQLDLDGFFGFILLIPDPDVIFLNMFFFSVTILRQFPDEIVLARIFESGCRNRGTRRVRRTIAPETMNVNFSRIHTECFFRISVWLQCIYHRYSGLMRRSVYCHSWIDSQLQNYSYS